MSTSRSKIYLMAALIPVTAFMTQAAWAQPGQVQANGITIAYESFGSADREAILLISGLGAQLTMWPEELCEELVRRGYRVIRFDNRDVGLSTHLVEEGPPNWQAITEAHAAGQPLPLAYTLEDMADDAVGLLRALGIEKAHIVGASMGGHIAQFVAINHPERTFSLTSIASGTGNPDMPGPSEEVLSLPSPPPAGSDIETIIDREVQVWKTIGSPDYPADEEVLRERIRRDVGRKYAPASLERQAAAVLTVGDQRERLRELDVPTVVLHGDADILVPVENGRETAATIPGAELRVIPGMGHDLPLQLVDDIADAITAAAERATGGND